MRKVVYAIIAVLSVGAARAGERLSSDELKAFYTDTTISGVHFKLGPVKTYYGPDGSVHSRSDSGKERIGKWWIDEGSGKRCIRWNNKSKDFCHYTDRNGDGTHTLIHGKNGKRLVEIVGAHRAGRGESPSSEGKDIAIHNRLPRSIPLS